MTEDFLDDVPQDFEEEKEHPAKKVIIAIMGIFLIVLILSYFLVYSGSNESIILGLIGSSKIDNNVLTVGNLTIEFDQDTYAELVDHYKKNDGNEIKVCLLGNRDNDDITINRIFYPEIISQSYRHVEAKPCPSDTIISMHSHPNRQCLPSDQDVQSYESLKPFNPNLMVAVLCEDNRLNFYS